MLILSTTLETITGINDTLNLPLKLISHLSITTAVYTSIIVLIY